MMVMREPVHERKVDVPSAAVALQGTRTVTLDYPVSLKSSPVRCTAP